MDWWILVVILRPHSWQDKQIYWLDNFKKLALSCIILSSKVTQLLPQSLTCVSWTANLVVISHELNDNSNVLVEVLDRDDPHDVGCVLRVGILAARVGHHQTGISLGQLARTQSYVKKIKMVSINYCQMHGNRHLLLFSMFQCVVLTFIVNTNNVVRGTLTLSRSRVLMAVPLKYTTWVKLRLNNASSSRSGRLLQAQHRW